MNLLRRSVVFTAAQVVVLCLSLASSIIVSRWLGPHGRGVLALVSVVGSTAAMLATFGLGTAYSYLAGKRAHPYDRLLGSVVFTSASLGIATAALLLVFSEPLLRTVLKGLTLGELWLTAVSIPFVYLTFFLSSFLLGAGEAERVAYIQVGAGLISFILIVVVVVVAHRGVFGAVVATTVVTALVTAWYLFVTVRRHGLSFHDLRGVTGGAASYGAKSYLGLLSSQFWLRADTLILNFYAGPSAVGEYSVAVGIAEQVWIVDSSVSQAILHEVIGSTEEESARLVAKTSRNIAFISGATCLAIAAVAPWVVPLLFGRAFDSAVVPLWLLLPGVLAVAVARPISSFFYGQLSRPQLTSAVSVVTAVVGVVAYLVLVPPFGASGAAAGSTIAYVIPLLAYIPLFKRTSGIRPRAMLLVNREDVRMYSDFLRSVLGRRPKPA